MTNQRNPSSDGLRTYREKGSQVYNSQTKPGDRYGRWLVISWPHTNQNRVKYWLCLCDCGAQKIVSSEGLRSGDSRSCGCLKREVTIERNRTSIHSDTGRTHGLSSSSEYRIWNGMRARCSNKSRSSFLDYGGRGITVCERWLNSFENFYADVGPRPGPEYSIDRFPDNNGNYEPGNVRWATQIEQARNRRGNRIIEFKGQRLPLSAWADKYSLNPRTLRMRLNCGWSVEKALTTPLRRFWGTVNN